MWYRWFYRTPLFLIFGGAFILVIGYVVMLLWNALIPALFHGPTLTFWQAIGILVLAKILFYNHRFSRWYGYGWHPSYYRHLKKHFETKLASMGPEDREKFRSEWRQRCRPGYWHHSDFQHEQESDEQTKKE
jgi:hypothetical protein